MSIPARFTVRTNDHKHYVTVDWLSNGHWMVRRETVLTDRKSPVRRAMRGLLLLTPGVYEFGVLDPERKMPDVLRIIPSDLSDYRPARVSRDAVYDHGSQTITAVKLKTDHHEEVGIAPEYLPILEMGDEVLIEDEHRPILVRLNGELVALVMPVRIAKEKKP